MVSVHDDLQKRLSRRAATCRHFTGIQHDTCEAGIAYDAVKDRSAKPYRFPCLDPGRAALCPSASYYTREEAEQREVEILASLERTFKARAAVVEHSEGRRGVRGAVACPCCESGRLSYTIAASNGHIWARCSTEGCVSWIE